MIVEIKFPKAVAKSAAFGRVKFRELRQQFRGAGLHATTRAEHLLMTEWLLLPFGSRICNRGEHGDLHPTVPRHNHLRDSAHADGISPEARQGTHLRGRLITRSRNGGIYT